MDTLVRERLYLRVPYQNRHFQTPIQSLQMYRHSLQWTDYEKSLFPS